MATIKLSEVSEDGGLYRHTPGGQMWQRFGNTVQEAGNPAHTIAIPNWDAPVLPEQTAARPTLQEEAERLLDYWERHGDNPEAVAKWAITDMLGILRYIVEEGA